METTIMTAATFEPTTQDVLALVEFIETARNCGTPAYACLCTLFRDAERSDDPSSMRTTLRGLVAAGGVPWACEYLHRNIEGGDWVQVHGRDGVYRVIAAGEATSEDQVEPKSGSKVIRTLVVQDSEGLQTKRYAYVTAGHQIRLGGRRGSLEFSYKRDNGT